MSETPLNHLIKTNWTRAEIAEIYNTPILELIYKGASVHRKFHETSEVQVCTLLSVKTGGCPEDCSYCPQAARYHTDVEASRLLKNKEIVEKAQEAKESGSTRFCMGAAWREVRNGREFDSVVDAVKEINEMGLEVCCTLGMLTEEQAQKLKDAGLYAYNHNLDTSEEYYDKIISTRDYSNRLDTLENVRKSGISVCSGGIIGMGEEEEDRIGMLHTLATLPEHPESVPVNALVPVEGTPLEEQEKVSVWEMIRMIATARIIMPRAMVRLSAGRVRMNVEEQALCFLAGANSIFAGDKLLTTPNPDTKTDKELFQILQIKPRESFKNVKNTVEA
ncbi:biotin synthase [Bernardetia litoralis DSM 6794]|uniref:Biotin synthase n=1 Tax=Bernardetia litoralis (strain ATCC 23117 / DSM 6794 / NBRC 15988 / NCIMB 1366 / Fx l1 / Sio-4) TaxID=880071 RepID=I4AIA5_BERLS|nr:biotin synthase BioB [Bernardetia litoralis]AFM03690.1 biotin synthase [Bernardetia litoralis DSM 6794]